MKRKVRQQTNRNLLKGGIAGPMRLPDSSVRAGTQTDGIFSRVSNVNSYDIQD